MGDFRSGRNGGNTPSSVAIGVRHNMTWGAAPTGICARRSRRKSFPIPFAEHTDSIAVTLLPSESRSRFQLVKSFSEALEDGLHGFDP
jgi:hypothetical protein